MPIRVLHTIHSSVPEDAALLMTQLVRALSASFARIVPQVAILGKASRNQDRRPLTELPLERRQVTRLGARSSWPFLSAIALQREFRGKTPDVVMAWDMTSAAAVSMLYDASLPVVVTLCDPAHAPSAGRWFQSLSGVAPVRMVCTSQLVQRRLVEHGVPQEATAVIRPGVDYGAIRQAGQAVSRESMGLPPRGPLLLTPSPPSREGGQFQAMWAAAILRLIWPETTMIVPGTSREAERLGRLVENIYCPEMFHLTGERYSRAELLSVADALIVAAEGDIPTGWIAWAMAAGVPVIAVAGYATAELIADRHNGFLCKSAEPHALATRIRRALDDLPTLRQCVTTARSQAYDVFRKQGCVDEYLKIIENVGGGRPVFEAVRDAAIV